MMFEMAAKSADAVAVQAAVSRGWSGGGNKVKGGLMLMICCCGCAGVGRCWGSNQTSL